MLWTVWKVRNEKVFKSTPFFLNPCMFIHNLFEVMEEGIKAYMKKGSKKNVGRK